jgi:hypothetical protein
VIVEGYIVLSDFLQDLVDQFFCFHQNTHHFLVILHRLFDMRDLHLHLKLSEGYIKIPSIFLLQAIFNSFIGITELVLCLIKFIKTMPSNRVFFGDVYFLDDLFLIGKDSL